MMQKYIFTTAFAILCVISQISAGLPPITTPTTTADCAPPPGSDTCKNPNCKELASNSNRDFIRVASKAARNLCNELRCCLKNRKHPDTLLQEIQQLANKLLTALKKTRILPDPLGCILRAIFQLVQDVVNLLLNLIKCLLTGENSNGQNNGECTNCDFLTRVLNTWSGSLNQFDTCVGNLCYSVNTLYTTQCAQSCDECTKTRAVTRGVTQAGNIFTNCERQAFTTAQRKLNQIEDECCRNGDADEEGTECNTNPDCDLDLEIIAFCTANIDDTLLRIVNRLLAQIVKCGLNLPNIDGILDLDLDENDGILDVVEDLLDGLGL